MLISFSARFVSLGFHYTLILSHDDDRGACMCLSASGAQEACIAASQSKLLISSYILYVYVLAHHMSEVSCRLVL